MGFLTSCCKWLLFVTNFLIFVSLYPLTDPPIISTFYTGFILCCSWPRNLGVNRQVVITGFTRHSSGNGYALILSYQVCTFIIITDGHNRPHLQQHCHPNPHSRHRVHYSHLLWLLWSFQREQMHGRNSKSFKNPLKNNKIITLLNSISSLFSC